MKQKLNKGTKLPGKIRKNTAALPTSTSTTTSSVYLNTLVLKGSSWTAKYMEDYGLVKDIVPGLEMMVTYSASSCQ